MVYSGGDSLRHGHQGRVIDPTVSSSTTNRRVKFAEHSKNTIIEEKNLCWQPLPGCFTVGDTVQYNGEPKNYVSGDKLKKGQLGTVTGPASGFNPDLIEVKFEGHRKKTDIDFVDIIRQAATTAAPRRKRKNATGNSDPAEWDLRISTKGRCPHVNS